MIMQSDLLLGVLALFLGLLIVPMISKRSNDAIYVCGPYAVYSLIAVLILTAWGPFFHSVEAMFPALLGVVLVPVLVAMLAKVSAVAMRNSGVLEMDEGLALAPETYDVHIAAAEVAAATGLPLEQVSQQTSAEDHSAASKAAEALAIAEALVCPFCGNPNIQHDHPKSCPACHHNLQLVFELPDGARCPDCEGILVRDAAFCHHCSKWLKGKPEDLEGVDLLDDADEEKGAA
jgi:hypothetical protein